MAEVSEFIRLFLFEDRILQEFRLYSIIRTLKKDKIWDFFTKNITNIEEVQYVSAANERGRNSDTP